MKKIRTKIIETINKNESSWLNLLILSTIALIIKQYCTHKIYQNLNYWTNFYINSFFTDAVVVLVILWIAILNQYIKNRVLKIFNNIICLIIFAIFCIDIFTIYYLQSRVSIFQAFQYVNNWWNWFTPIVIFILIITLLLRTISLILTKNIKKWGKITRYVLLSIFFFLWWMIFIFNKTYEIKNVISLNVSFIKDVLEQENVYALWDDEINQKEEYEEKIIKKDYEDYLEYVNWEWKDLNIILIFAESLSAIDSANMWWNDNMLYFDKIQREWITFTNFITNWTTSDTAHIATLFWVIPLRNIRIENSPYTWYKLKMQALPEYLNSQWYNTTFISTADLSFLNQRDFLVKAWFQKIIWEENFIKNRKYTFDAAPDKDLYDKVLEEVANQTWKYFIWLQTISFHKPYNTPSWKTEKSALQYSDEELYRFYKKLERMWFFKSWILVIVWDHRKMTAAENLERDIFWPNRYTRSVATVVWAWIQTWTTNNNLIQHTDFYNSIKKLVWHWWVEIDWTYNNIFNNEKNRDRWITNSSFYIENWYTITANWNTLLFKNLSNLPIDNPIYNYFKRYIEYEFWNNEYETETTENNTTIKIIWHRWSIKNSPENTLQAFLEANKLNADWIEFDVSYTKDHENIVAHGDLLYTSNCYNKKVFNMDYEEIQQECKIQNWEDYIKLEEMLELIDWLFDYYFLELKVYDEALWWEQARKAIDTVKKLNMQNKVIFISYSDAARKVLNEDPDIIYWRDTFDTNDLDFIGENNSKYFLAPYESLTPEIINKAKELWKEIVTYTINDTWNYEKMVDYWIKIILTDEIELLKNDNYIK